MIRYRSTRATDTNRERHQSLDHVILRGLASDGGLYIPETLPQFDAAALSALAGASYAEVAQAVLSPFLADFIGGEAPLRALISDAYRGFRSDEIVPVWSLDDQTLVADLHAGPTFAFKDIALQLLGGLLGHLATSRGQDITLIGATSGDTGAAAIEAVRGRDGVRLVMLHPKGRVTDTQRRQMTTVTDANILNVAVAGSFDDCQALVKAALARGGTNAPWAGQQVLSSVNSINWIRILGQAVYYAYLSLTVSAGLSGDDAEKPVLFSVPSGNFGDAYAGYLARQMGFPVGDILIATNANDILARTLETGTYDRRDALATLAPAMDIQVASNFERLLFDACGQDGVRVQALMTALASSGQFTLKAEELAYIRRFFSAISVSDETLLATMKSCYQARGERVCPHTAIGVHGAQQMAKEAGSQAGSCVVLATAHWGKFSHAAEAAFGSLEGMPSELAALASMPEFALDAPNDAQQLEQLARAAIEKMTEGQ